MAQADKEIILFQIQRSFTVMCKSFLNILEDLQTEHQIHFDKLKEGLPIVYETLIDQADYFSDDKYSYLRKKVFDKGGEINRELQTEVEKYNLTLKRYEKDEG